MITVSRLDHVGIRVRDFARTVSFYQQFGFDIIRDDRHKHVVVLRNAAGAELNLLDSADTPTDVSVASNNVLMDQTLRYPGYTHIALQVADINDTLRDVAAADIRVTEGPVTFGDGKTSIFFRDPDRNVIELTQLPAVPELRRDGEAGR